MATGRYASQILNLYQHVFAPQSAHCSSLRLHMHAFLFTTDLWALSLTCRLSSTHPTAWTPIPLSCVS